MLLCQYLINAMVEADTPPIAKKPWVCLAEASRRQIGKWWANSRRRDYPGCGGRRRLSLRLDVLIYAEKVRRVTAFLNLHKTLIIPAVRRPDAIFTLFHHEVDVRAACGIWMERAPILLRPCGNSFSISGVRIDSDDYLGPRHVAVPPWRCVLLDAPHRAIDRIEVHRRFQRRHFLSVAYMLCDGFVGKCAYEIRLPIPLHPGCEKAIEKTLQSRMRNGAD